MSSSTRTGQVFRLGGPWPAIDPFLFAVHHVDHYPAGTPDLTPAVDVSDRPLGQDFGNPSGWNMYHGTTVPGFPAHPHRGFETITVVRRGFVDHADSTGAAARYGGGDVQWVTAGGGVSHSEMFPLLNQEGDNDFELYQIWLNLPARNKSAPAEFKMLWNEDIPDVVVDGGSGAARVRVVAGRFGDRDPLAPPTNSWAAEPDSDVAIWLVDLEPGAVIELPAAASADARRVLYVHGDGARVDIDGTTVESGWGYAPDDNGALSLRAETAATVLLLQGVPIGEPVAAQGPFVMNTEREIAQAYDDYRRTRFGGWPWPTDDPVHPRQTDRFARYGDGRLDRPNAAADDTADPALA
ncbi:pirin family protein [Prescottella agglutinans]|uniref:Redox-sensitive bicupin YhaK (Pirin superfamily) n=1 Tax=Prescottella agglutinans TaxID=1644129 RepID=A0ABT6MK60_9NOCA|nr:pirin family protein [Prescottella agglutinans]MDH6284713.1 redox-sensitive bicupin YhaK (pirin superfamily) [Prescottella agglutinans]